MKKKLILITLMVVLCLGFLFAVEEATQVKDGNATQVKDGNATQVKDGNATEAIASANTEVEKVEPGSTNFLRIYRSSRPYSHFILGIFLFALFYGSFKFYTIYIKEKLDAESFHLKLKGLIKSGSIKEAIAAATLVKRTTLGQIYRIGLLGYRDAKDSGKTGDALKDEVQNAFNEATYQTIPVIDRGLHWFDLLAQVSTYLGLLGTIMGLIAAFGGLDSGDQSALTAGIQTSMGTTALGLIGAIVIQFIKGFLSSRAEKIINDIDEKSVKIMNVINNQIQG